MSSVGDNFVEEFLKGPHLIPDKLTAQRNTNFLESVLLELLGDVIGTVRLWFQHDRAPARCEEGTGQWLNTTCIGRWTGRGGPDLNSIDFLAICKQVG
jgi:hypothetical protein